MDERKTIYLDDAMDALRKAMHADIDHMAAMICDGIEDVLNSLPSAQPEHIKCRDCKEYCTHDHRCRWWNHGTKEAGWCSYAERRIDG